MSVTVVEVRGPLLTVSRNTSYPRHELRRTLRGILGRAFWWLKLLKSPLQVLWYVRQ